VHNELGHLLLGWRARFPATQHTRFWGSGTTGEIALTVELALSRDLDHFERSWFRRRRKGAVEVGEVLL
jgi:hypothetical protein